MTEKNNNDSLPLVDEANHINHKLMDSLYDANKQITELEETVSNLTEEQTQLIKELDSYKASRMYRIQQSMWGFSTKLRNFFHRGLYAIVYRVYRKLERFPKIISLLHRVNNRLGLFKNKKEALQLAMARKSAKFYKQSARLSLLPKDVKVAILADEFTYNCFKYECTPVVFEPDNWFETFEKEQPALFLCESAWSGVDSEKRPWKGRVYASCNFSTENRTTLLQILDYCKKRHIPTVFWNKEDPTHYTDRAHDFVKTAVLFDHIFTTAEECVEMYRKDYGCKSVHCMPFAAQPKLFNPIETYQRTDEVIFAGSWYRQHEQRSKEMEQIFDAILASGHGLKIYDRFFGSPDPLHFFPEQYKPYILPSLPFTEIDRAYKGSRFALNINTVVDSRTMFARRVFELMHATLWLSPMNLPAFVPFSVIMSSIQAAPWICRMRKPNAITTCIMYYPSIFTAIASGRYWIPSAFYIPLTMIPSQ